MLFIKSVIVLASLMCVATQSTFWNIFGGCFGPKRTTPPPRRTVQPLQPVLVEIEKCKYFGKPLKALNDECDASIYHKKEVPYFIENCTVAISAYDIHPGPLARFTSFTKAASYNSLIISINNLEDLNFTKADEPVYIVKLFLEQLPISLLSAYIYLEVQGVPPHQLNDFWEIRIAKLAELEYKLAKHLLECFHTVAEKNLRIGKLMWPWFIRDDEASITAANRAAEAEGIITGLVVGGQNKNDETMKGAFDHLLKEVTEIFGNADRKRSVRSMAEGSANIVHNIVGTFFPSVL